MSAIRIYNAELPSLARLEPGTRLKSHSKLRWLRPADISSVQVFCWWRYWPTPTTKDLCSGSWGIRSETHAKIRGAVPRQMYEMKYDYREFSTFPKETRSQRCLQSILHPMAHSKPTWQCTGSSLSWTVIIKDWFLGRQHLTDNCLCDDKPVSILKIVRGECPYPYCTSKVNQASGRLCFHRELTESNLDNEQGLRKG